MSKLESLGITRIEALHYYVRDTRRTARFLVDTLDFREVGGDQPGHVEKTRQRTTVYQAGTGSGGVRILVSEPVGEGARAHRFLRRHPEGIGLVIFGVKDAAKAFELLESRGGTPLDDLQTFSEGGGTLKTFAMATPFGDTTFRFVERNGYQPFYPGYAANPKVAADGNRFGFTEVDHLTSNFKSMSYTSLWLENVMGFEKFWEIKFHTRDMAPDRAEGSGLKSIVHKDPNSPVKFANNEPLRPHYRASQIHLFDVDHGGDGVQHAALATPDLIKTVSTLQASGAPFMSTPGPYYDALAERMNRAGVGTIDEDIEVLRKLQILVDGAAEHKYLLQIFMQDMATIHKDPKAGPFFLELIQRKGDQGFGYGNFRALFESIEREQKKQGRISLMLQRLAFGKLPEKHHTALRDEEGRLFYEECLTRDGFEGPYTLMYHRARPQAVHQGSALDAPPALSGHVPEKLARRHYRSLTTPAGKGPFGSRLPLLFNEDVVIGVAQPTSADPTYVSNGDGDELIFVFEGSGTVRSILGDLRYEKNDYILLPRGVIYRILPDEKVTQRWFTMEFRRGVGIPAQWRNPLGQLRMDAPYCHRDFQVPAFKGPLDEGIRALTVKKGDHNHAFLFDGAPLDVVGWDGTVYPLVFPILKFQPRVGMVHLPPTWHGTFAGSGALVCSFVPRPVDFHPQAIPCPYPHSNVDVDEVILYCSGNFTSRRGVGPGSVSFHPAGVAHGPHPHAYEKSIGTKATEELAVMLDCYKPLKPTEFANAVEDAAYQDSFSD